MSNTALQSSTEESMGCVSSGQFSPLLRPLLQKPGCWPAGPAQWHLWPRRAYTGPHRFIIRCRQEIKSVFKYLAFTSLYLSTSVVSIKSDALDILEILEMWKVKVKSEDSNKKWNSETEDGIWMLGLEQNFRENWWQRKRGQNAAGLMPCLSHFWSEQLDLGQP